MTKETYVRAIVRNLRLPHKTKRRIKNDLLNDFIVRMEAGESQEQIIADMGAPEKVAAEFHENFSDQLLPHRTALDWILFIGGIFFGVLALWQVIDSSCNNGEFRYAFCSFRGYRNNRRCGRPDLHLCGRFLQSGCSIGAVTPVWNMHSILSVASKKRKILPWINGLLQRGYTGMDFTKNI